MLWLFVSSAAFAVDPTEQLYELARSQWTAREGAPTNIVKITQARDWILWLASEIGLFQFDGVRFQRLALADGTQPITAAVTTVKADSDDLWIGMRSIGAIVLLWPTGDSAREKHRDIVPDFRLSARTHAAAKHSCD